MTVGGAVCAIPAGHDSLSLSSTTPGDLRRVAVVVAIGGGGGYLVTAVADNIGAPATGGQVTRVGAHAAHRGGGVAVDSHRWCAGLVVQAAMTGDTGELRCLHCSVDMLLPVDHGKGG